MGYLSGYRKPLFYALSLVAVKVLAAAPPLPVTGCPAVDFLIENTLIVDGSGGPAYRGSLAILDDKLLIPAPRCVSAKTTIDGTGLHAVPGFINSLSWGAEALFFDQSALSDLRQGISLEIFGEGWSLGPLSEQMALDEFGESSRYGVEWRSFFQGMRALESKQVAVNFSSYVGASTLRKHVMGDDVQRTATPGEISDMLGLARQAMADGAIGVGMSLESSTGAYASDEEILALAGEVAKVDGLVAAHIRNEGIDFPAALSNMLSLADKSKVRTEILHLKVSGGSSDDYRLALARIQDARNSGLSITANMYPYNILATSSAYLKDYDTGGRFSNISPEFIRISQNHIAPGNKPPVSLATLLQGEFASVQDIVDSLAQYDAQRIPVLVRFTEENALIPALSKPWVSIGTDASTAGPGSGYFKRLNHPRSVGAFPKYLRMVLQGSIAISFEQAVAHITAEPAAKFRLCGRGKLANNYFADLALLDLSALQATATFDSPRELSTGVHHLFINGVHTIDSGQLTTFRGGRYVPRAPHTHSDLGRCHL